MTVSAIAGDRRKKEGKLNSTASLFCTRVRTVGGIFKVEIVNWTKFGNLESWMLKNIEIWKFGYLKIWKFGNFEIYIFKSLEIWIFLKFRNLEIWKFRNLNI